MNENQQRVLHAVRRGEALSVSEIAQDARLTQSQARTATAALVKAGLLRPAGVSATGARCYVVTAP